MKSRMVGHGDLSDIDGIRTDSPTADIEARNMVFSFAASKCLRVKTGDISNAYLQGKELDRILLLKPPRGGLPDPDNADGETVILARVLIYGTKDAGRYFWKHLCAVLLNLGFEENETMHTLFSIRGKDGKIAAMLYMHVDDLLWAATEEATPWVQKLLDEFDVRKVETDDFRFCGKEVKQDAEGTITVTCQDTTEKYSLSDLTKATRQKYIANTQKANKIAPLAR